MNKRLVQKFDYALKRFLDEYWDLADIHYFVDSSLGSDLNAGTYDAPFKTMSKAQTVGANSQNIMINGYFYETLSLTKTIRWIGAGGGVGGRTIFGGNITQGTTSPYLDNIIVYRNNNYWYNNLTGYVLYNSNCIFFEIQLYAAQFNKVLRTYSYYSIFYNIGLYRSLGNYNFILTEYGNNNTFYDTYQQTYLCTLNIYGNNNHINNTLYGTVGGYNNLTNIDGQYLDITNFNFNFLNTSPLYRTGTFNGLFGDYNHVGAGTEGMNDNGASAEYTTAGGAVHTNMTISGTEIYRPDVGIDGTIVSYYVDMGAVRDSVVITVNNTFVQTAGKLNRLIQETAGLADRNGLDYILQYGDSTAEVDSCPELLMEQGKIVTVSGTGASRVGNCDPTFDINNYTVPSFQYYKVKFRAKTV